MAGKRGANEMTQRSQGTLEEGNNRHLGTRNQRDFNCLAVT